MKKLPYGRQDIQQADINAVVNVLKSDYITQGPLVEQFEHAVADTCHAHYGVAVNSATSALHIACLALEVGPGDLVWTSPNTFVASANCARLCGADVDFVDIDPLTYNLCDTELEKKLKANELAGLPLPKVVIAVHFAGQSCNMNSIHRLAKEYGFFIIEDASHAIGGSYLNSPIGSCEYSDITVFSFHPVKIITCAEGGVATTNSKELAERMALYRGHGVIKEDQQPKSIQEPWRYQQIDLGLNYRMTEMQAALGLSQLDRLRPYIQRRHEIASYYKEALAQLPYRLPYQSSDSSSSLHLFPIRVNSRKDDRLTRSDLYHFFHRHGVGVNVHYIPVHTQPYYQELGYKQGDFPVAEAYYEQALSLPIFGSMEDEQARFVTRLLIEFDEQIQMAA